MVIATAFVLASLVLFVWRRSLPNAVPMKLDLHPGVSDLEQLAKYAVTLGLFLSPAALAVSPVRAARTAWRTNPALTLLAVAGVGMALLVSGARLLGNYVTAQGGYPSATVVRVAPDVIPSSLYSLARVLGAYALCIGALVIVPAITEGISHVRAGRGASFIESARTAPAPTLLTVFVGGLAIVYVFVIAATTTTFFDRYLVPLVPAGVALLIAGARRYDLCWRASWRVAAGALVVYGAIGFVYVDAAATVDGAKWRAAEQLEDMGYPARTINAGYEWFGLHQRDDVEPGWQDRAGPLATRLFTPRPVCATVVLNGTEAAATRTARNAEVIRRWDAKTLLGRDVILQAVRGPSRCDRPGAAR
jgi:hypothetical protein